MFAIIFYHCLNFYPIIPVLLSRNSDRQLSSDCDVRENSLFQERLQIQLFKDRQ